MYLKRREKGSEGWREEGREGGEGGRGGRGGGGEGVREERGREGSKKTETEERIRWNEQLTGFSAWSPLAGTGPPPRSPQAVPLQWLDA